MPDEHLAYAEAGLHQALAEVGTRSVSEDVARSIELRAIVLIAEALAVIARRSEGRA